MFVTIFCLGSKTTHLSHLQGSLVKKVVTKVVMKKRKENVWVEIPHES